MEGNELIQPIDFIPHLDKEILFFDNRGIMGSEDKRLATVVAIYSKEIKLRTNNNLTMNYPLPNNPNNRGKLKFFKM